MRSTAPGKDADASHSLGLDKGGSETPGFEATEENVEAESSSLFFDEHADSEDERWVRRNLLQGVSDPGKEAKNFSAGDAFSSVSCPSCFSILSMQTQPHIRYDGQFRAIFVTNCKTVTSQRLHVKGEPQGMSHAYQPVACANCSTEVGVRDSEGVYHFCNVMY